MKRLGLLGAAVLMMMPILTLAATPSEWTGAYVGGQVGWTQTKVDYFSSENALNLGAFGGYNYQFAQHVAVGGDIFYEWNEKKDHKFSGGLGTSNFGSDVYGVDGLVGFPLGSQSQFMPYVKLGYVHLRATGDASGSDNDWRYGAGFAWRMSTQISLYAQYMYMKLGSSSMHWKNETYAVGAAYHF